VYDDSDDDTDTQTTSSSSVSVQSTERELQAKVSQLKNMFPNISRPLLEEALNFSNGDYEGAVDHIVQQQAALEKGLSMMVLILWLLKADKHCVSHMCCLLPAYLNVCFILMNSAFRAKAAVAGSFP